jgi:hypothetical protein
VIEYLTGMVEARRLAGMSPPAGFMFGSVEEFVLNRGQDMAPAVLTDEEMGILRDAQDHLQAIGVEPELKQCFYNAQSLAFADVTRTIQYMEGYAQGAAAIPVHHGWAAINGKLIDLTWMIRRDVPWAMPDFTYGEIPEGWFYRGAYFPTDLLLARMHRRLEISAVLGDWVDDFPVLRTGQMLPEEEEE